MEIECSTTSPTQTRPPPRRSTGPRRRLVGVALPAAGRTAGRPHPTRRRPPGRRPSPAEHPGAPASAPPTALRRGAADVAPPGGLEPAASSSPDPVSNPVADRLDAWWPGPRPRTNPPRRPSPRRARRGAGPARRPPRPRRPTRRSATRRPTDAPEGEAARDVRPAAAPARSSPPPTRPTSRHRSTQAETPAADVVAEPGPQAEAPVVEPEPRAEPEVESSSRGGAGDRRRADRRVATGRGSTERVRPTEVASSRRGHR